MDAFVRVAETGSFTAVAEHLGLARSMVTRQISGLEAHLGVKLIARSTRSLKLTAEGEVYLERCREILGLVGAAEGDLSGGDRTRTPKEGEKFAQIDGATLLAFWEAKLAQEIDDGT